MNLKKTMIVVLVGILFVSVLVACDKNAIPESSSIETGVPDSGSILVEATEEQEPAIEGDAGDEDVTFTEYRECLGAYLDILAEKSSEIESSDIAAIDGKVAVMNVLGDKTPELLYEYHYVVLDFYDDGTEAEVSHRALKIFSYTESGEIKVMFDSVVFMAAGGGNNYCVYLTREGELMLYRSNFGAQWSWGFWPIVASRNLEIVSEYWNSNYSSDLAKLYYARFYDEDFEEELFVYKENGEEVPKAQYDKTAKELIGDVGRVIFQGIDSPTHGLYGSYEMDELWKDRKPFEAECMSYAEAVTWLERQIAGA